MGILLPLSRLPGGLNPNLLSFIFRLKYIVTDDLQTSQNSLVKQFHAIHVVKCAWRKKNNLIENFDCAGVYMLIKAA